MEIGPSTDSKAAADAMLRLRSFHPFRFSGTWYVAAIGGTGYAYRSKRSLVERWRKLGHPGGSLQSFRIGSAS
jgi:hypothetical protein